MTGRIRTIVDSEVNVVAAAVVVTEVVTGIAVGVLITVVMATTLMATLPTRTVKHLHSLQQRAWNGKILGGGLGHLLLADR